MMNVPAARVAPSASLSQRAVSRRSSSPEESNIDNSNVTDYHVYAEESVLPSSSSSTAYRGFSTSITGSFQVLHQERVDACSLVCCGILQSDRDRYLLTGRRPPSCLKRTMTHVVFPLSIFMLACYASVTITDVKTNQVLCTVLIALLAFVLIYQCCKGRWKRTKVRKELLWRKYHMRKGDTNAALLLHIEEDRDDESIDDDAYAQGQTKWDIFCAHSLLGCYATDIRYRIDSNNTNNDDSQIQQVNVPPDYVPSTNLCACLWNAFTMSCCGRCCGVHLQLCGMCALAQEGREVERLMVLPKLDYLSYQPVLEYAPALWANRSSTELSWYKHFTSLSTLSRDICIRGTLTVLLVTLLWPKDRWDHLIVVAITFAHAILFLALVHWPKHSQDVSVDALIKYFASGFLLATTLAISWELVLALVLRTVMVILFTIAGIDVAYDEDGYQTGGGDVGSSVVHMGFADAGSKSFNYHAYLQAWGDDHPVLHIFYLLVSTYCVAALVEEICKYLGFRMVDHVDVWTNEDVQKAIDVGVPEGFVDDDDDDDEEQHNQHPCCHPDTILPSPQVIDDRKSKKDKGRTSEKKKDDGSSDYHLDGLFTDRNDGESQPEQPPAASETAIPTVAPKRTLQSIGAATTISMVACALGFACCENLVYMFLYHQEYDIKGKLYVLLIRALMPIHPLLAAIQSIGVCRRDLERESSHQLGRIILPAVLLHGTFDFCLWLIAFMSGGHYSSFLAILSWSIGLFLMLLGLAFYIKQSLAQRKRLARLDSAISVDESNLL